MMTYQRWLSQTKRNPFTPRSDKLKAIDNALLAYEQAQQQQLGTTRALTTLFNALYAWIENKGANWKASVRNSKTDLTGKGTVELLLDQVLALNPAFRGKVGNYLTQSAPSPRPLLQLGNIIDETDEDGGWHKIPIQTQENSCGPCAIRIVIQLVNLEDVGEQYLRELVETIEEGPNYRGGLGKGGELVPGGAHDWSPNGKGTWMVPAVLDAVKPPIKSIYNTDLRLLFNTTKSKPAIGVVQWSTGDLHYVVVRGKNKNGDKLKILDPFYGVQSVSIVGGHLDNYQPIDKNSQQVIATASWYKWVCKVS